MSVPVLSSTNDLLYGTTFSAESIKVIAESVGCGSLADDAAKELAEDVSKKVKQIVQDAAKFMHHSKRERLLLNDIESALKVRNCEPQYGFTASDFIPFRFASGGGRELHFIEEKEMDLNEIIQATPSKIPIESHVRSHWLVIDGIQPTTPDNPPPLSKDLQALDSVNPVAKLEQTVAKDTAGKPATGKVHKLRNVETVHVKQLATHELSVEQQLYYKEITEACVGADEPRRGEALQSLAADPGLHEMLPRMCTFIAEGVKVNVVQNNLALLIYLMRMVKALLDNPSLYLEKYLHELIPSVTTCIVSKQLCMRPELDNHWALRDFASRLMAQICKNFNTSTNNLQTRVTRIFGKALQNEKTHLSTLYGSIAGLSELGGEVIKVFIIPRLRFISERIEGHLQGTVQSNTEKTAAGHIRAMLQKCCPPILKQIRSSPDYIEEYKNDYGYLGSSLCQAVAKARAAPSSNATASVTPAITSSPSSTAILNPSSQGFIGLRSQVMQINPTRQVGNTILQARQQCQPTPQMQKILFIPQSSKQQSPLQSESGPLQQQSSGGSPIMMPTQSNGNTSSAMILESPTTTEVTTLTSSIENEINDNNFIKREDRTSVDSNTIIIETEQERPPPELDDLSHLE